MSLYPTLESKISFEKESVILNNSLKLKFFWNTYCKYAEGAPSDIFGLYSGNI